MADRKLPPKVSVAQVEAWFREAWPDLPRYPSASNCYSVAVNVNVVRALGMKAPKRHTAIEEALIPARKFLRLAAAARREIDSRNDGHTSETLPRVNGLAYPKLLYARARIDAAEEAIDALLQACEPIEWNDPAQHIGAFVREAWATVPNSKPQLGIYPQSPLVVFIEKAFGPLPNAPARAAIADRLRGRIGGGGSRESRSHSGAKSPK